MEYQSSISREQAHCFICLLMITFYRFHNTLHKYRVCWVRPVRIVSNIGNRGCIVQRGKGIRNTIIESLRLHQDSPHIADHSIGKSLERVSTSETVSHIGIKSFVKALIKIYYTTKDR